MPVLGRRARARSEEVPLAPIHHVQSQEIFAVEHPMIIQNLDRALKTFGTNRPFRRILDSDDPEECLPLYLRPNDPMCVPTLSVNAPTTNVVLQITVPKRTGRKRKRGSQDPFTDVNGLTAPTSPPNAGELGNTSSLPVSDTRVRRDNPAVLRRMLQDNVDRYSWKAVGLIKHTHRFRGTSDFQQSTGHERFIPNIKETLLRGHLPEMNKFELSLKMGVEPLTEIVPPPAFTHHSIPFNWAWQQNPHIFIETDVETGANKLINHSANTAHTAKYLPRDSPTIPTRGPTTLPVEESLKTLLGALRDAFDERPLWTRRGLLNRLGHMPSFYLLRNALPYVGYMFKGGPFRDAIVKYGVDPRSDPKYRIYQTLFFKVFSAEDNKEAGDTWEDLRTTNRIPRVGDVPLLGTHHFDGKNLTLDGKVWQICDITDPLLKKLIDTSPIRDTCDMHVDGWFQNGRLAKVKAVMKVKLIAIRTDRVVTEEDFCTALSIPDIVPGKSHRNIHVPVPDLRLSEAEVQELQDKGVDLQSLGITLLRKKENQINIHAMRARGTTTKEKRGRYQRKNKLALPGMSVDVTMAAIRERKDKRNLASKKSRDASKQKAAHLQTPGGKDNEGSNRVPDGIDNNQDESLLQGIEGYGGNGLDDGGLGEEDDEEEDSRAPNEFGIDDEGDRSDARTDDEQEEDNDDNMMIDPALLNDAPDDSDGTE